jgi:site-specific recombinase XerD
MRQLEKAVFQDFCRSQSGPLGASKEPDAKLPAADLRTPIAILRILTKLICRAAKLGFSNLPVPHIPTLRSQAPSPFCNVSKDLGIANSSRTRLEELVGELDQSGGDGLTIELMLASAILYGAILNSASLVAIVRALTRTDAIQAVEGRVYIELSLSWRGMQDMEMRRWYPDVLTSVLLLRLKRESPDAAQNYLQARKLEMEKRDSAIAAALWQDLRKLLRFRGEMWPKSLKAFLGAVTTLAYLDIPPILVSYAQRTSVSHSLKPIVFERLFGLTPRCREVPPEQPSKQGIDRQISLFEDLDNIEKPEPGWLCELRIALREKKPKDALAIVSGLGDAPPPATTLAGRRMIEFTEFLLRKGAANGRGLAVSSAKAYMVTISKRFVCRLGGEDPAGLEPEALAAAYDQVLEDSESSGESRGRRRQLREALKKWHFFLATVHSMGKTHHTALFASADELVPVDASILTVDEYREILEHIRKHSPHKDHPELERIARILVVLGFRCGLRRMEALMLRVGDFCDSERPELLVRPWALRKLKTKNATRKLPLYALLDLEELGWLRAWIEERRKTAGPDECLFGITDTECDVVSRDRVFGQIHDAMKAVASSDSHYHLLRHSFATWTYLKLMLAKRGLEKAQSTGEELDGLLQAAYLPIGPNHAETLKELKDATLFAESLYSTENLRYFSITRKHALAVASLLGHSFSDMSVEHYIHCLDWLLAEQIGSSEKIAPPLTTVIKATGEHSSTAYRWHSQGDKSNQYSVLIRKMISKTLPAECVHRRTTEPNKRTKQESPHHPGFDELWEMLVRHEGQGRTAYEVTANSALSVEEFARKLEFAKRLRDIRVEGGTRGYRHRMEEMQHEGRRLPAPAKPREAADKTIVKEYEIHIQRLIRSDPQLVRDAVGYYVNHTWQTENRLMFKLSRDVAPAKRYLDFLRRINIGLKFRQYVITAEAEIGKQYVARWAKALKWNWRDRERAKIVLPRGSQRPPTADSLDVQLIFNPSSKKPWAGQFGFRYLMLMTAIAMA